MMGRKQPFSRQLALNLDEAAVFGPSTLRTGRNKPTGQKLHLATLRIHQKVANRNNNIGGGETKPLKINYKQNLLNCLPEKISLND